MVTRRVSWIAFGLVLTALALAGASSGAAPARSGSSKGSSTASVAPVDSSALHPLAAGHPTEPIDPSRNLPPPSDPVHLVAQPGAMAITSLGLRSRRTR
ncbi:MAG: hypothetical protein E6K80_09710 [Candidatus Eisenbacteria bacterium]|uniref:PEP-CTERM sorting domain-containing protein n=1 Tax=Eiseniibacteriota bacterium TaxID=2212470 RepID=A0A538U2D3_UNCEI|nr:MAG: hypothetical protein E6K80_09710 [Candidatus Eisenbacteria bacterium]